MITKKYNNKRNVTGHIIKDRREKLGIKKTELCRSLELQGVYIDRNELSDIENNKKLLKDFELLAIAKVLDLDLNSLRNFSDN